MRRSLIRRDHSSPSSPSSSSSSIDSSSNYHTNLPSPPPLLLTSSSVVDRSGSDRMRSPSTLPTDLSLGLTISPTTFHDQNLIFHSSPSQQATGDWPPMKPLLRRAVTTAEAEAEAEGDSNYGRRNLFVKVKMEGIRIGRKVDVLAHHGYPHLINTLENMFTTPNILWAGGEYYCGLRHVLTYQDQEGDWMMIGDVPWEMFLTTVKRLKVTRTHMR